MKRDRSLHRMYLGALLVGGLVCLAILSRGLDWSTLRGHSTVEILLWLVAMTLAAMSPIPLPRKGAVVYLTSALDIGAILVFGPALAAWLVASSRIIANFSSQWTPFTDSIARLGRAVLAICCAGMVYSALGGNVGFDLLVGQGQHIALFGGCAMYVVLKRGVSSLHDLLGIVSPSWKTWWKSVRDTAPYDIVLFPFAVLLALTHLQIGVFGVALFLIPLLFARYAMLLWVEGRRAHVKTVRTLMYAVDAADPYTRGHSYRISKMSVQVAQHLRMPPEEVEEVEYAALLHDIGRTAIQRSILMKPGRLTDQEQAELRSHPRIAHDILRDLHFFENAADIVHAHHEQPDGQGYPRGLREDAIPVGSRIIMVVAAFDAMTSDRPYRRGLSPEGAFEELLSQSGGQFFPEVVEALITLYSNGTLYAGFEDEELIQYLREDSNSRALEEFLDRSGFASSMPEKKGMKSGRLEDERRGEPIIEFPGGLDAGLDETGEHRSFELGEGYRMEAHALSNVGCVRDKNEDYFGVFDAADPEEGHLLVLADGMGGAAAGEVASMLAVETVSSTFFSSDQRAGPLGEVLERSLQEANRAIHEQASDNPTLEGMGTTCTAAAIRGRFLQVAHVGDTRAYLVSGTEMKVLTVDHTLAVELERLSSDPKSTIAEARNVLTRCLGADPEIDVDLLPEPVELKAGDMIVLCSDGLTNQVVDEEILEACSGDGPEQAIRSLVDLTRERGGFDNISVVVGRIEVDA